MPDWIIVSLVIFILIALNAIYVAAEFSTVSARRARLALLSEQGVSYAAQILSIIEDPHKLDAYVATSQVGITFSSLVLGFYGQAKLASLLSPALSKIEYLSESSTVSISTTIVLIALSLLQVLLGELVPKNVGIKYPERFTLLTAPFLAWSEKLFKPLIFLLNGSGIGLMKLLKINPTTEHAHIHSPEEIALLIEESGEGGAISPEEHRLLINTMRMRQSMVKHVMIPRAQMLAGSRSLSIPQITEIVTNSSFSRLPIYHQTIDNIIGIVHLRELFCHIFLHPVSPDYELDKIIRPVIYVPETMQIKDVFTSLQLNQYQVAIVLDEFGGTAGMVTLEDLVEEIFGDLQDEFDQNFPAIQILSDTQLLLRGDIPITELNALLKVNLPSNNSDTLGGLIAFEVGHIPKQGECIHISGLKISVDKMQTRAVLTARMDLPAELIAQYREQR